MANGDKHTGWAINKHYQLVEISFKSETQEWHTGPLFCAYGTEVGNVICYGLEELAPHKDKQAMLDKAYSMAVENAEQCEKAYLRAKGLMLRAKRASHKGD